ncbi:LOW QUALITY PROTEIN: coiled-coil domain-containing protein 178 [Polymixia lowei]
MPEVEPLRFPSREGGSNHQDQGDLQAVCPSRRRSCALVNTPSPCVNKAIYHIQELKRKVENWCQQSGKFQPQMAQDKQQYSKTFRVQPSDSDAESISTELYIEGIGLSTKGELHKGVLSPLRKETTDVLVEVVYLIERLEADRQDTEEAFQKEKRKKRLLESKIDSISLWKQHEYPYAVQKEHEACIRDIAELKWHLKRRKDKLDQGKGKLLHAEVLNQRLNEDISFVKKHGPLVKEKLELESDIVTQMNTAQTEKLNGEAEVSHLEEVLGSKRTALTALHAENKECELEVEDYKKKTQESEKAVKQMLMDRKRMLQKIRENEEQRDRAKEELTQVVAQHSAAKSRLEEREQLTFMEEQRARKATENVKKELMGKMKYLALLKSSCAAITEELQRHQRSSELANQELQKEYEDASTATKDLEIEIEGLRKLYNDKAQKIEILTEKLKDIQCKHRNTLDRLEKEKILKYDHLNAVKELHAATIKRYDQALSRISDLTEKSTEYRDESDKMEKISATMPQVIEELQRVFDLVEFKNRSAAHIMNNLQSDINNCLQRTQQSEKTHTAHCAARQRKMEDTKEQLRIALQENAELAGEYSALRETLTAAKGEAARAFDEKNRAEESLHHRKQLSLLQKRMHKAMVKYFKQRSLYSQGELDHCQALSQETNQKIKTVQEELSNAIQRISAFLQPLTDDSTTTDGAAANKQAAPDASGLSEMPTVQIAV